MYRLDRSKKKGGISDLNIGACLIIFIVLLLIIGGVCIFSRARQIIHEPYIYLVESWDYKSCITTLTLTCEWGVNKS